MTQALRACSSLLLLIPVLVSMVIAGPAWADAGSKGPHVHHGRGQSFQDGAGRSFLMVADPGEKKLFFYRVPAHGDSAPRLTGVLPGVDLGEAPAHGGTIALPDGRILMNDETAGKTLAVRLDDRGRPRIADSVSSTLGKEAPWTAVSPDFRYYAVVSSGAGSDTTEFVNLIDLKTFQNTRFRGHVEQPGP